MASNTDWLSNLINEHSDKRTSDWMLIKNPSVLTITTLAYLYFVYWYGPNYMKDKKPYNLKKTIAVYNIGQILTCIYIFYGVLTSGWLDEYSLGCQPVDRSPNPKAYRMAEFVWYTMILKVVEFAETIFFIMRKKENQVSALHVYHHVSTLLMAWITCKFMPGGMATFPILINCIVHVVMYTYYLVALLGGRELQMKLQNWKRSITMMQMVQFTVMIIHSLSALRSDCNVPTVLLSLFLPDILLLYYMFYKFYQTSYNKKK